MGGIAFPWAPSLSVAEPILESMPSVPGAHALNHAILPPIMEFIWSPQSGTFQSFMFPGNSERFPLKESAFETSECHS